MACPITYGGHNKSMCA